MNFKIDKQTAAIINNVAGDQRIEGGQHRQAANEFRDQAEPD